MFRKLLPRQDDFFQFFEKHAAEALDAATTLVEEQDASLAYQKIKAAEGRADDITHHCIEALHKHFITPIERTDIHRLISTMDDVVDEINDVAKFILLYKLKPLDYEGLKISKIIVAACNELACAMKELRKRKNTNVIQSHFKKINELEGESDELYVRGLQRLFEEEKDVVKIIKIKEIYEHLESAVDACEDVANILEGITLENE